MLTVSRPQGLAYWNRLNIHPIEAIRDIKAQMITQTQRTIDALTSLVKLMVKSEDEVQISAGDTYTGVLFHVSVALEDTKSLFGEGGKTIAYLREIVRVMGANHGTKYALIVGGGPHSLALQGQNAFLEAGSDNGSHSF